MPITITISDGSSSKGLKIKGELVDLYSLDTDKVRHFIKQSMSSSLFDSAVTAQMIMNNIEEID